MHPHPLPLLGLLGLLTLHPAAAETADPPAAKSAPGAIEGKPAAAAERSKAPTEGAVKAKEPAGDRARDQVKDQTKTGDPTKPGTKDAAPAAAPVDAALAAAATAAATGYLTALRNQGFSGAAAHLHPDALTRFKALVLPRLKEESVHGSRTLLNATFGRTADYAAAAAAAPADFLARFGRVISVREPDAAPRFSSLTPVGVLREGERLHVLVRLNPPPAAAGTAPAERLEVVTLLAQGNEWKVDLDGRLQSVAANLGAAGAGRATGPRPAQPRFEPLPEGQTAAPLPGESPAPDALPRPTLAPVPLPAQGPTPAPTRTPAPPPARP